MPKIFILGDIHGMRDWREKVSERRPEDHVIFLGDYFDPYSIPPTAADCLENFLAILAYADENPNTFTLLGNHDYHYFSGGHPEACRRIEGAYGLKISRVFEANRERLLAAYGATIDGRPAIATHAGLTATWLEDNGLTGTPPNPRLAAREEYGADAAGLAGSLNDLLAKRPEAFAFVDRWGANLSGDDPFQGPLWVRPSSLLADAPFGFDQYVGHTHVDRVESEPVEGDGGKVVFTNLYRRVGCFAGRLEA